MFSTTTSASVTVESLATSLGCRAHSVVTIGIEHKADHSLPGSIPCTCIGCSQRKNKASRPHVHSDMNEFPKTLLTTLHKPRKNHPANKRKTSSFTKACPTHPTTSIHLFTETAVGRKDGWCFSTGPGTEDYPSHGKALSKPP